MNAWIYSFAEDGQVYEDVMDNYIDLEYYPIYEIPKNKLTVLPFSRYLEGETSLVKFVRQYSYLLTENKAESIKPESYKKEETTDNG